MREIKYEAWDNHNRIWLDTSIFSVRCDNGQLVRNNVIGTLSNITLRQYTGLKDKNGKEIYEGDVVRCHNIRNGEFIEDYVVVFEDAGFCKKSIQENEIHEKGTLYSFGYCNQNDKCTLLKEYVIGNIYENPELLEQNK